MKVLYVFPHPDDESFGVGQVMAKQSREGHEVHLLTLTRGGATKQRHRFGYTVDEMGAVRAREMTDVASVLDLASLEVLDFPDSGLKEVDPRDVEAAIAIHTRTIEPDVLVTYPVHGVSGFHDHLVAHALVKRVFVELESEIPALRRLAFSTVSEETAEASKVFPLSHSTSAEIDCVVSVEDRDLEACRRALDCYVTFKETIDRTGIKDLLPRDVPFEFFAESCEPPVEDVFAGLG